MPVAPSLGGGWRLVAALSLLVALTVGDGVLVVILFDTWGEEYSLFINQGTAFVYIVLSSWLLGLRRERFTGGAPAYVLVCIGIMNGSANFLMAISQPHTPGLSQTLLSLLGIPLVLTLTWACFGTRPSCAALAGAGLIIAGTALSSLRGVFQGSGAAAPIVVYSWAVLSYAAAQGFVAGEKVFEEKVFRDSLHLVRPMQMFLWTLVTQFLLGWGLYPLQTIPALGGVDMTQLPALITNGTLCAIGRNPDCTGAHAAIFWAYCAVDFWCYYFGLWVLQRGGASLQVLSSSIALPMQQLFLCARPLVGRWAEDFFWGDGLALVLVLLGFGVYQGMSPEGRASRRGASAHQHLLDGCVVEARGSSTSERQAEPGGGDGEQPCLQQAGGVKRGEAMAAPLLAPR